MKTWYSFDFKRLITQLLPMSLRRLVAVLFFAALLSPLGWLIKQILYKMQHNCQVIYLEKLLNESFAITAYNPDDHEGTKVIKIGPGEIPEEVYIWLQTEPADPLWLGEVFLLSQAEADAQYCDFTVLIPMSFQAQEYKLQSLLEYYKLAGKKYKIIYL